MWLTSSPLHLWGLWFTWICPPVGCQVYDVSFYWGDMNLSITFSHVKVCWVDINLAATLSRVNISTCPPLSCRVRFPTLHVSGRPLFLITWPIIYSLNLFSSPSHVHDSTYSFWAPCSGDVLPLPLIIAITSPQTVPALAFYSNIAPLSLLYSLPLPIVHHWSTHNVTASFLLGQRLHHIPAFHASYLFVRIRNLSITCSRIKSL